MSECIIHIGMHKTGTTSIQQNLYKFEDGHFYYANIDKKSNHSLAIYTIFANNPESHPLHALAHRDALSTQKYKNRVTRDLIQSINESKDRKLIISGEDIARLNRKELDNLKLFFEKYFNKITIIGYVRPPMGYITSAFQQQVKATRGLDRLDLKSQYRSYRDSFHKFDLVFGRDNVHLWKFSRKELLKGCVTRDMASRLGIHITADKILPRSNQSLSRQLTCLLFTYNRFLRSFPAQPLSGAECNKLIAKLKDIRKDKFRFSQSLTRDVIRENRQDILWIESRLGDSLAESHLEDNSTDIRTEADLLNHDPDTIATLRAILGNAVPHNCKGETPKEVAQLIHLIRKQL